jgi:hypothetical protein
VTLKSKNEEVADLIEEFRSRCSPLERPDQLMHLVDARIDAHFCECHIRGSILCSLGTTDAPIDPEEQPEYKGNREIDEDSVAFQKMKDDAKHKRSFSNIIVEWRVDSESASPLKIVGGQHRYEAIRMALQQSCGCLSRRKSVLRLGPSAKTRCSTYIEYQHRHFGGLPRSSPRYSSWT